MHHTFGAILLLLAGSVQASAVTWTLEADDAIGAYISGTFDYDADTGVFSNVNLTSTDINLVFTGIEDPFNCAYICASFNSLSGDSLDANTEAAGTDYGSMRLFLSFSSNLTNAGGVVGLGHGASYHLLNEIESYSIFGTVTAVPVPAAAWLFGSALAGLGFIRRRKTA